MIHKIFTVYDHKAKVFAQPFFSPQKGAAIRVFADTVNEPDHPFNRHPEDYVLFYLGDYDDSVARIEMVTSPEPLGSALDFKSEIPNGTPIGDGTPVFTSTSGADTA